jgi:class 3 adenylate cyclase
VVLLASIQPDGARLIFPARPPSTAKERLMDTALAAYLPQDRRCALAQDEVLPEHTSGAALFADISGFTALTEGLDRALGHRRGTEELTRQLNQVYTALIAEVERYGGSVIDFAGDSIMCWFDDERPTTNVGAS